MRLYAATAEGVARLDEQDGGWHVERALRGRAALSIAPDPHDPDTLHVGLGSGGVRSSRDGGRTWSRMVLANRVVTALAVSAADRAVYAGTEPSALLRSDDGGEGWRELDAMLEVPSAPRWSWPPKPWTSRVRAIAPSPHAAGTVLVGIEVGALLRTTDGGVTWQDHRPGARRDVHAIAWHPRDFARAYMVGSDGTSLSRDAGDTWERAEDGLDRDYLWPLAVDPVDPERWYTAASTDPITAHFGDDPRARVYRRRAGEPWRPLGGGLPTPLPALPFVLLASGSRLFAGLANGELWESPDRGDRWHAGPLDAPLGTLHGLVCAADGR